MERIVKFSNRKTVANLSMVSKDMRHVAEKVNDFHKFHYSYSIAIKEYKKNKNKETKKKKKLYQIFDLVVENQDFWRLIYKRGNRYEMYCRNIQKDIRKFLSLDYVPKSKRMKYLEKLSLWKTITLSRYNVKEM